jgi:hypothetical protein
MKWAALTMGVLLGACSDRHNFVVDVANAEKPVSSAVVTICKAPPRRLKQAGNWFVGTVTVGCEGSGKVRLTHSDGSTTDCRVGYVTTWDDWWIFELRGRACEVDSISEGYVH